MHIPKKTDSFVVHLSVGEIRMKRMLGPRRTVVPKWVFVIAALCSVLFFVLAAEVRRYGPVSKGDRKISAFFHDKGWANSIFLQAATDLGSNFAGRGLWATALVLILARRWQYIPALWLSVSLGGHINAEMQRFFARARPRFSDMPILTNPGFPSGHTAGAALFLGFLIIVAICEIRTKSLKIFAVSLALAFILLIGFSRIALLVHHASDVVGSILWCTAWLVGCYYANIVAYRWSAKNLERWNEDEDRSEHPPVGKSVDSGSK